MQQRSERSAAAALKSRATAMLDAFMFGSNSHRCSRCKKISDTTETLSPCNCATCVTSPVRTFSLPSAESMYDREGDISYCVPTFQPCVAYRKIHPVCCVPLSRRISLKEDRKSVVEGKRVAVRVDLGGGRIIK